MVIIRKSRLWVSGNEGEGEHLEEGGIDHRESLAEYVFFIPDSSRAIDESCLTDDVRNGVKESRSDRRGDKLLTARLFSGVLVELDLDKAEKLISVLMKIIEGQLIRNEQINEDAGGDPKRQSEYLYE